MSAHFKLMENSRKRESDEYIRKQVGHMYVYISVCGVRSKLNKKAEIKGRINTLILHVM